MARRDYHSKRVGLEKIHKKRERVRTEWRDPSNATTKHRRGGLVRATNVDRPGESRRKMQDIRKPTSNKMHSGPKRPEKT